MAENIHLVLKTHLDIGFTHYAEKVVEQYFTQFIPQAIELAAQTRNAGNGRFRWTIGAWLIYEYLEKAPQQQRAVLEQAIEAEDIVWHALPFTTHTELMDESLFRFGLSYSQKLDQRFGRKTIAAKMTDVPGHTRSMIPLLAEAGIKLLHLGVNPASTVPDMPPVSLWRDEATQTEICVVYEPSYGGVTRVEGLNDVLAVVLTGDNQGPPSASDVEQLYARLTQENPGATVTASTLDAFAEKLWPLRETLPLVTSEIGDTWIRGVGTDPTKVSQYRALSRLRTNWLQRDLPADQLAAIEAFSHHFIMIPEHTWGMDEKVHFLNHNDYTQSQLAQARTQGPAQAFEASWAEQRAYLTAALAALEGTPLHAEAQSALTAIIPTAPDLTDFTPVDTLTLRGEGIAIHICPETGSIVHWEQDGQTYADMSHQLASLRYDVYGSEDYARYWDQYIRDKDDPDVYWWAYEDNIKVGMPTTERQTWHPRATGLYQKGDTEGLVSLNLPEAAQGFGGPTRLYIHYTLNGKALNIAVSWFEKPANRIAEAFWLSFKPTNLKTDAWRFEKIGRWIDPTDVISKGGRDLHAVDQQIIGGDTFTLTTYDAPLVAPDTPSLLDFHNRVPNMQNGVHICLYDNIWGTNFPMWFEDDALFRFTLQFD
jgi:hypothetical protein